ncbi:hypothetical protein [Fusibacter sp. JL216-2]|uniref:hypothetical protein n=1 Tax=Fusibacter sp. JL216-2 TaxID=3071453 RepID=UPI003D3393B2
MKTRTSKQVVLMVAIIIMLFLSYRSFEVTKLYDLGESQGNLELELKEHIVIGVKFFQIKSIMTENTYYKSNVWRIRKKQSEPLDMYTFDVKRVPNDDEVFRYWTTIKLSYDLSYIYVDGSKMNKHTGRSSSENFEGRLLMEEKTY